MLNRLPRTIFTVHRRVALCMPSNILQVRKMYTHENSMDLPAQFQGDQRIGDFRSDTVTLPTPIMLQAMMSSSLGDDVYKEDATVNQLETTVAGLCGKEEAVFCPTGTMTNQIGMRLHLQPLHTALCDTRSHIFNYESGGVAYHSQAQLQAVNPKNGHHLTLDDITENFEESDHLHTSHCSLIALENTLNGLVMPIQEIRIRHSKISQFSQERGLKMHLDGARLWNASVKTGVEIKDYCKHFDTISLCFSKGLGAPIGSCLVGSSADMKRARHFRKLFGGGWRQAGVLAGAALYALGANWLNMYQDHEHARQLYYGLTQAGFKCEAPETNMVWVDTSDKERPWELILKELKGKNVIVSPPYRGKMRLVCHLQVEFEHVETLVEVLGRHS